MSRQQHPVTAIAEAKPRPRGREVWITLALVAVMAAGLLGVAAATGWEETLASLAALGLWQVLALLALAGANYVLRALRWFLYARALGLGLSAGQAVRHYLGGFAMTVTPGRLGEFIRLRWIWQEAGAAPDRAAPLVLMDRAGDLAATGVLIGLAAGFSTIGLSAGLPVAAVCIAAAVVVTRATLLAWVIGVAWRLARRWPRLFARARRAAWAMAPFSDARVAATGLTLGCLGWFAEGLSFWLLLGWMGAEVPLWTAVGIFMIATVTGSATGAPGGIGGAEAVMVALLSVQGVPLAVSVPATAVIRLTTLWFALAIGLLVFPYATRMALRGRHADQ